MGDLEFVDPQIFSLTKQEISRQGSQLELIAIELSLIHI